MRPRSRTFSTRAVLTGLVAAAVLVTSCSSDGLSVAVSYDNTIPATAPEDATTSPEVTSEETADTVVADTAAPTFTFPKPTMPDTPATVPDTSPATVPDVTAAPTSTEASVPVATAAPSADEYTYVEMFDDTGLISAWVPSAWADVDGSSIASGADGGSAPTLEAAPDLEAYRQRWDTPGMRFVASAALAGTDPDTLIDDRRPSDCDTDGSEPYDDGVFSGRIEVFTNCGGIGTSLYVIGATSPEAGVGVIVSVQVVTDADVAAFEEIQRTFNIHS